MNFWAIQKSENEIWEKTRNNNTVSILRKLNIFDPLKNLMIHSIDLTHSILSSRKYKFMMTMHGF